MCSQLGKLALVCNFDMPPKDVSRFAGPAMSMQRSRGLLFGTNPDRINFVHCKNLVWACMLWTRCISSLANYMPDGLRPFGLHGVPFW